MCKFILPSFIFNIERWKWNSEFRVYVSNLGHFKDEHKKNIPYKINSKTGYVKIKTPYGLKSAHRLVLMTWRPIPNAEDMTVDHLNGNKRENTIYNLEWVTQEENTRRAAAALCNCSSDPEEISSIDGTKVFGFQAPTGRRIKTGKNTFNNIDEAIVWMQKSGLLNGDEWIKENVEKKIKHAIKNNKLYCGRKWKYVN